MKSTLKTVFIAAGALFVGMQAVPYGRDHINSPVRIEPRWDGPKTQGLARRACFDCHSNETVWPWYSDVAPVSWLVTHDVEEGRGKMNLSEWDRPQRKAKDAVEEVEQGEMPPSTYLPLHGEAKLSNTEKQDLMDGLRATLAADPK